ncbi:MAG: transketolase C-terminal domain-containing protein [Rhodospirillales bacterium]|jgi:pyruvate dehydrogenase E1 component beta subunit|nr:transketolase C-terminal domain-containing protein [Rhodospirillales bacterium]
MALKNYCDAMADVFRTCFAEDPNFTLIGNEVFGIGPQRVQFEPLQAEFAKRIFYPPISEAAYTALAAGAAMCGHRMFLHIGVASFAYPAISSIANEIATAYFSSGGRIKVPMVIHLNHGIVMGTSAQHSESPQPFFWNTPGMELVLPSSPSEAKGLMRTAVKSDNPTVIFTHGLLYGMEDEVPDEDYSIPFGVADIKREGSDATLVATSLTVSVALEAAEQLAEDGIDVEVIDPRTLVPLDKETILKSVAKTGRLVVADETRLSCGVASEISAIVAEEGFQNLKSPIIRMARPDAPVSAAPSHEAYVKPTPDKIVQAVRKVLN